MIALGPDIPPQEARAELTRVSSLALGYDMPVEIKTMLTDADAVPPRVRPAQDRTLGGWGVAALVEVEFVAGCRF